MPEAQGNAPKRQAYLGDHGLAGYALEVADDLGVELTDAAAMDIANDVMCDVVGLVEQEVRAHA